ncbi:hypothetical protein Taro_004326 [Colocasia esculenta]|uniref:Uncharacterized protein n=1 Tax=Colocasia esculenta TaxID=4460 RepID=A0A843TUH4_COLES|nr:hypothetical protein [Colocasia esculenta]
MQGSTWGVDSDLMFWAIQNQEINTAKIMIERMKFASSQVWDKKSKLNVSLPYAHLLTKVFQHYGISVVGDVSEKMGKAIRSRNLRKRGFSLVNSPWTKTSMAEGEAIIGEAQEVQKEVGEAAVVASVPMVQEESAPAAPAAALAEEAVTQEAADKPAAAEARVEEYVAIGSLIEEIPPENIFPVVGTSEDLNPTNIVASILRDVLESISSTQGEPERFSESVAPEVVASGHTDEIIMEEAPSQGEQAVAHEKISVEDAPIEGEQSIDEEAAPQGEHTESVPMGNEEHVEFEEPIARAHS